LTTQFLFELRNHGNLSASLDSCSNAYLAPRTAIIAIRFSTLGDQRSGAPTQALVPPSPIPYFSSDEGSLGILFRTNVNSQY